MIEETVDKYMSEEKDIKSIFGYKKTKTKCCASCMYAEPIINSEYTCEEPKNKKDNDYIDELVVDWDGLCPRYRSI